MTDSNKQATKDKIFKEAAELFSQFGYYKVSVREICEAAGVSKPVLYYYFKDKETLLFEMMKETRETVEKILQENVSPEMNLAEQLEGVIKFYIVFIENYPHLMKFSTFVQVMTVPEKIREFKHTAARKDLSRLEETFKKAQVNGELKSDVEPRILVLNFLGTIIMILSKFMMNQINESEYQNELYKFLEFWKHNFLLGNK